MLQTYFNDFVDVALHNCGDICCVKGTDAKLDFWKLGIRTRHVDCKPHPDESSTEIHMMIANVIPRYNWKIRQNAIALLARTVGHKTVVSLRFQRFRGNALLSIKWQYLQPTSAGEHVSQYCFHKRENCAFSAMDIIPKLNMNMMTT